MTTVGIVGASQLGSMLAMSIFNIGADVRFFDSDEEAPGRRFGHLTVGDYANIRQVTSFARECDVLTYEFENVSAEGLSGIANVPIFPSIDILRTCQIDSVKSSFLNPRACRTCDMWLWMWAINSHLSPANLGFRVLLRRRREATTERDNAIARRAFTAKRTRLGE